MRPLTHRVWEQHYTQLRPYILEEWPDVDRMNLEAIRDDWDGLIEAIQDATGLSADLIQQRLKKLDVDALGLGTGAREEERDEGRASLDQLRLGDGFAAAERERIVQRLAKLNRRLRRFPADATELLLTVKNRDATSQKVTLECGLPHFRRIVATSTNPDLRAALMEVREDLWRQIDDAVAKRKEVAR
jgi:ribosome-associated translation inhibitor RaiA